MVDYSIDSDFNLHFNEWDDFVVVDGLEEFEQDVVIQLHENLSDVLNYRGTTQTAREKIVLEVTRIAKQFGVIESVEDIDVRKVRGEQGSYEVRVIYKTSRDAFSEQL